MPSIIGLSLAVIFRPTETFRVVKAYRSEPIVFPALLLMFLLIVIRIIYIYLTHYPLATLMPINANFLLEIIKYYIPIFTWVIASFAVTAILGGESQIKEIFMATTYALMPYILFILPLSLLSRVLSKTELGFYNFLSTAIWIWVILLFFISIKTLNEYSVIKTFFICILILYMALFKN